MSLYLLRMVPLQYAKDSDMYKALDVLRRDVQILGIISDWPAMVSYYASCTGLD